MLRELGVVPYELPADGIRPALEAGLAACGDTLSWSAADAAARQVEAIAAFRTGGVEPHVWTDGILDALRRAGRR